ncbi:MAG TPA: hypothetical protein VHY84_20125 [Bryobacteraceae bacterium]|jgi:hypothetical protein|nr:hypothetical protein [Bryobacteraceae bacterium]
MCDYSLMMVPNRLAVEGEELAAHRFSSGSMGLLSIRDFDSWVNRQPRRFWQWLMEGFSFPKEPRPVVCVPPGARLRLMSIPEVLKSDFPAGSSTDAVFTQISAETSHYRDALCFANGTAVLLQLLPEGQRLRVLRLSSSEDFEPERNWSEPVLA